MPGSRGARRPAGRRPDAAPDTRADHRGARWPTSSRSRSAPPAGISRRWRWRACPCTRARAATAAGSSWAAPRTDLSGLNAAEARALFLVAGPSSSATPELKAALRKLVRALPETFRSEAEAASTAVVVDNSAVGQPRRTPPGSSIPRRSAERRHRRRAGDARLRRTRRRAEHSCRASARSRDQGPAVVPRRRHRRRHAHVPRRSGDARSKRTGEPVVRPDGFDLAESWRLVSDEVDQLWAAVRARGTAAPESVSMLRGILGSRLRIGPTDCRRSRRGGDRRARACARWRGSWPGSARCSSSTEPPELREQLAQIGAELVATYATDEPASTNGVSPAADAGWRCGLHGPIAPCSTSAASSASLRSQLVAEHLAGVLADGRGRGAVARVELRRPEPGARVPDASRRPGGRAIG